ncbi:MAG: glycine zipper 2TM domain-containing protein [Gammaproteobacteria bacterium]|nr:glycine zipper 2TM domain-containing protein [Gammaproteobacteria bacterium]
MTKIVAKLFIAGMVISLFSACAPDISSNSYSMGAVGTEQVEQGVILQVSHVNINANQGIGGGAGAALGATAGSAIGGDTRANIIGGIAGALIGGIIGNEIDKGVNSQGGLRYIIKLSSGRTVSIVQGMENPLRAGQRVLVTFTGISRGGLTRGRVTADNSYQPPVRQNPIATTTQPIKQNAAAVTIQPAKQSSTATVAKRSN